MNNILKRYENYLKLNNIKKSSQREFILKKFLDEGKHITAQELYSIVHSINKAIGIATVYRAVKFFCEAGIAKEIDIGDGTKRYELNFENKHHDHLICTGCGRLFEIFDDRLEKIQNEICEKYGFKPVDHTLHIYGLCKDCNKEQ